MHGASSRQCLVTRVDSRRHEKAAPILAVGPDDARVAARAQRCLHHRPVLRVRVQVADVAAATRSYKARRSQLTQVRRSSVRQQHDTSVESMQ